MGAGFNVNEPVKIVEDGDKFDGLQGIVKGHDVSGSYWVQVEGYTGCFEFPKESLELNIVSNLLEIVLDKHDSLPEQLDRILEAAKSLQTINTNFFTVLVFDIQRKLWKELADALADAKNADDIADYSVKYWSVTADYTVRPR